MTPPQSHAPAQILVIDVGGNHIKAAIPGRVPEFKFVSGPSMTPAKMVKLLRQQLKGKKFDAVAIGYPGVVARGKITREPYNLGRGWKRFDFEAAFGRPTRIVNDAAMQALGSYERGRMLFLGLGTGLGSAMVVEGLPLPMELAHLPYKDGLTFEDFVGERALERLGKKKWRKEVFSVVEILRAALEPDYVVLGGGNLHKMKALPPAVRPGDNENAFVGGVRVWAMESARTRGKGPRGRPGRPRTR